MATTVPVKGQLALPRPSREAAGSRPDDRVNIRVRPEGSVVSGNTGSAAERAGSYRARLDDMSHRRPIRGISTEDIMQMTRAEPVR